MIWLVLAKVGNTLLRREVPMLDKVGSRNAYVEQSGNRALTGKRRRALGVMLPASPTLLGALLTTTKACTSVSNCASAVDVDKPIEKA